LDTVAVNRCVDRPPRGPCMIGYSIPSRAVTGVLFHCADEFMNCSSSREALTGRPPPVLLLRHFDDEFKFDRRAKRKTGNADDL
jgi:hypothetical protein